ncbi:MAG: class I SAM-dependent methyltransferase [Alphaproteobacteria bacterium]|nr:class I SAM-dependent methyltransferase [Alphaproteobacteria bacterium]
MDSPKPTDYRARLLARYVSTHTSVSGARDGLARRRAYLERLVVRHFPPARDATVLDLGCGHGAIVWAARNLGYTNVTGVDASPEQVAAAKDLGIPGIRHGDLRTALNELAPDSLDSIILFDLFHYFDKNEQMAIADAVFRALKPGGRFILHLPNAEAIFSGRMRYWDMLANDAFTQASIGQLLLACDFTRVACFEDTPAVHGLKSRIRALLWPVVRAAMRLILAIETGESGRNAVFSQCLLAVATK